MRTNKKTLTFSLGDCDNRYLATQKQVVFLHSLIRKTNSFVEKDSDIDNNLSKHWASTFIQVLLTGEKIEIYK